MSPEPSSPATEQAWFTAGEEPHLIGSRCGSCGTYAFPPQTFSCPNPRCDAMTLEPVPLSRRGRVWSFAVNHYAAPPPALSPDPFEPYAVAAVELDEERMVVLGGLATGADPAQLEVGMAMELVLGPLYEDDDHEYVVWQWAPAARDSGGAR